MSDEHKQFLIPKAGVRVVDPNNGQPLPERGAEVRGNREYWIRRVNDGDVAVRDATTQEKTK